MEVKKWSEYSESEKQTLLNHLFTYYGKLIFNLEELEMFSYLTSKIPDTLFKIFVSSYLVGENGQTIILEVLRNEKEKNIIFNAMSFSYSLRYDNSTKQKQQQNKSNNNCSKYNKQ